MGYDKTAAGDRSGTVGPGGVNTAEDSGSGHRDQSQPLPVVDAGPPTTKPVNAAELFRKLGFDPKGLRDLEDIRGVEAPLTASRGRELANEAKKDAKQKTDEGNFSSSSLHDSDADAYRHALWNYLMTQKLGPDAAKRFGDAHEVTVPNPDFRTPDGPVQQQRRPRARPRSEEQGPTRGRRDHGGAAERATPNPAVQPKALMCCRASCAGLL